MKTIDKVFDMSKLAVGYLRASTCESKQRNSLASQKRTISAFAALNGYTIAEWRAEYASGGDDERKGFRDALRLSEERGYTLIAAKVDRLSRSLSAFSSLEGARDRIRIAELGDEPVSELHLSLLLVVGQNERKIISQRVKDSYKHLKAIHGDNLNWGNKNIHTFGDKGRATQVAKSEKHNNKIVELVLLAMSKGGSLNDAVDYLNELGLKTRRGQPYKYSNLYRIMKAHKAA
jgi:predicted site-specific integrase-resolvase